MADFINTDELAPKKEIAGNASTALSITANVDTLGGFISGAKSLGNAAKIMPWISIPFEMYKDGPIKGLVSGVGSSIIGTYGLGIGFVGGALATAAVTGNIPLATTVGGATALTNSYLWSKNTNEILDKGYDKIYPYIRNSEEWFAKSFDKNLAAVQKGFGNTLNTLSNFFGGNVLNKDLSPSGTVLNGYVSKDGNSASQAANIPNQALSADNAYTHPEVNTDPTQRILTKNGAVASPSNIEGSVSETSLAAASDPASLNKVFKTPNMESMTKVLYSGVQLGAQMLTGYFVGRATEMVLGKQGAKIVGKIQEYKSYYNMATYAMKTFASSTWSAIANSAFGQAVSSAWTALSNTVVGQAVAWVNSAISFVTSAITNAVVSVVTGIANAIATSAVGVAVGNAIGAFIGWIAALAFPW